MLKTSKFYNILILFCFALGLTGFLIVTNSAPSCAQSTKGCATDTWQAMVNRAAMETRRDDVMNKRYIVKADSVLQYSCFRDELINTVENTGPIFSNGETWVGRQVPLIGGFETTMDIYNPASLTLLHTRPGGDNTYELLPGAGTNYKEDYILGDSTLSLGSLDFALTNVVGGTTGGPLFEYLKANFSHIVLSGTTDLTHIGLCHEMANVWKAAKCKNFDGTAVFYSFEDLAGVPNFLTSADPREFPPSMPCEL